VCAFAGNERVIRPLGQSPARKIRVLTELLIEYFNRDQPPGMWGPFPGDRCTTAMPADVSKAGCAVDDFRVEEADPLSTAMGAACGQWGGFAN
jgi:hypothetical protein